MYMCVSVYMYNVYCKLLRARSKFYYVNASAMTWTLVDSQSAPHICLHVHYPVHIKDIYPDQKTWLAINREEGHRGTKVRLKVWLDVTGSRCPYPLDWLDLGLRLGSVGTLYCQIIIHQLCHGQLGNVGIFINPSSIHSILSIQYHCIFTNLSLCKIPLQLGSTSEGRSNRQLGSTHDQHTDAFTKQARWSNVHPIPSGILEAFVSSVCSVWNTFTSWLYLLIDYFLAILLWFYLDRIRTIGIEHKRSLQTHHAIECFNPPPVRPWYAWDFFSCCWSFFSLSNHHHNTLHRVTEYEPTRITDLLSGYVLV